LGGIKVEQDNPSEETFDDIKKIEEQAKSLIEKAVKRKEELLSKAKEDNLTRITQAQKKRDTDKDKLVEKKTKEIDQEAEQIINSGKSDLNKLDSKIAKNQKKAEEFILDQFDKLITGL
jgi:vacuolar-type H+-ATPase subunit H